MDKEQVLMKIMSTGILAVVRAENEVAAERIADACYLGGIKAIEVTFTVPHADKVIEHLVSRYKEDQMLVGAGTVMDAQTARIAMLSGAQFVVSPHFDPEIVKTCNRYRLAVMPGVMSIGEAVRAMESGADILKVFPAELFGPKIIRAINAPIPNAKMIPTGGVEFNNVGEWIKAGAVAVGVGGSLTQGAKTGDYKRVTETARLFIERIQEARHAL